MDLSRGLLETAFLGPRHNNYKPTCKHIAHEHSLKLNTSQYTGNLEFISPLQTLYQKGERKIIHKMASGKDSSYADIQFSLSIFYLRKPLIRRFKYNIKIISND